jgi:hypothetical protein
MFATEGYYPHLETRFLIVVVENCTTKNGGVKANISPFVSRVHNFRPTIERRDLFVDGEDYAHSAKMHSLCEACNRTGRV